MPARFELVASASPPYFRFTNAAGAVIADSRDKLFRVTDVVAGATSFGQRVPPLNSFTTRTLGSCNGAADFVLGFAKITYPGGRGADGLPEGDWFNVSGTYLHVFGSGLSNNDHLCHAAALYTFRASGGIVVVDEHIAMTAYQNEFGQTLNVVAIDLYYELWVGTFV